MYKKYKKILIITIGILCIESYSYADIALYSSTFKELIRESYDWYCQRSHQSLEGKTKQELQDEAERLFYTTMDQWVVNGKEMLPPLLQSLIERKTCKKIEDIKMLSARKLLAWIRKERNAMPEGSLKQQFEYGVIEGIYAVLNKGHTHQKNTFDQISLTQGHGNCVARNTLFCAWLQEAGIWAMTVLITNDEVRAIGRRHGWTRWEKSKREHFVVLCKVGDTYEIREIGKKGAIKDYEHIYIVGTGEIALSDMNKYILSDTSYESAYAAFYSGRGTAYRDQGNYGKAILDHTKAITLDAQYAFAYNNRAAAYQGKGNYVKAIADYTEAIKIDPKCIAAYNNRGAVYESQGNYEKAMADYTMALQLDPNNSGMTHKSGLGYKKLCKYRKAIANYMGALKADAKKEGMASGRRIAYVQK